MKILYIFIILILTSSIVLNAQISDSYRLSSDDLRIEQNAQFQLLNTIENSYTDEIGNPQLPVKIISFVLPYESTILGIDINVNKQKLNGSYYIYPVQPPRMIDGSDAPPFTEPNPLVYSSSTAYPAKTVEIISDGYTHGYHVVTLAIYPVEYHPANREIYLRDISFTINYTGSFDNNSCIKFEKQSYKRAELGKNFVKTIVKNSANVEDFNNKNAQIIYNNDFVNLAKGASTSAIDTHIPEYIIITNNNLKQTFQELADWKTKKGVPTIIKTVEDISKDYQGSDLQEKIRNYLKDAYSHWGASLFILLGGDTNIIPARLYSNTIYATDLYYATIDGTWNASNNDLFGEYRHVYENDIYILVNDQADYGYDFFLGRASVENITEAQTFVSKVINYEKATSISDLNYYKNILIAAAFLDINECGNKYTDLKLTLKGYCNTYLTYLGSPYQQTTKFLFDNYDCTSGSYVYGTQKSYCNPAAPTKEYAVPGGGICTSGDNELNKANFISALNNGGGLGVGNFHIIYHCDHSNIKSMGTSSKDKNQSINNSDFDNLTNGNYQQILFTNGCSPSTFNFDCITKRYVNNIQGGGVAAIGSSGNVPYYDWSQFNRFLNALYGTSFNNNLGVLFQNSSDPTNGNSYNDQKRRLTLLGDPEMPVWTTTPQILAASASLSTSIAANGERTINITINGLASGKKARVCLQKTDECYETREVTNGSHSFSFLPHTSGSVNITITAQNYIPWEWSKNLTVYRNIYISNLSFDDDRSGASIGNGDRQLDAGERIELTISLKNQATSTATNVSAYLVCNMPQADIAISDTISSFPNINAGASQNSNSKYVFTIGKDMVETLINDASQIKFTLNINATIAGINYSYYDKFNIDISTPELELGNQTILTTSNGNKEIEAGETVTIDIALFNSGKAEATGLSAELIASSSNLTIISSNSNYSDIGKYETKTNNSGYQFSVSPSYIAGQQLFFTLIVTNEYGKTWDFLFNLNDRPTQQVSNIDFVADTNSIKLDWTPLAVYLAKGYNIYRCNVDANNNEIGDYEKLNTFILPAAFYHDEGLTELTKFYYKISAVSHSDNEGPLSEAKLAWTSYSLMDGFPVTMGITGTIKGSINVEDVNGDGNKEIFTSMANAGGNNGYLIALKSDNVELFDIDNNSTTYSGFAELGVEIWSTPAIGQLEAGGAYKVLSVTRDPGVPNKLFCHSTRDDNSDGKPEMLWTKNFGQCFRSPIIANIDNSPDGTKESIFYGEYGGISIFIPSGNSYSFSGSTNGGINAALAVADIDLNDNGKKEIIGCYGETTSGIYIWKHNGANFANQQPYYTLPNNLSAYTLQSSVVVCDLNNNGKKDILTVAIDPLTKLGQIIAIEINPDGSYTNIWTGTQAIAVPNARLRLETAVGDLNNDGKLEVVVFGNDGIYIWSNCGAKFKFIALDIGDIGKITPILADVDDDPEAEIILTKGKSIDAYKMNGKRVFGFPLLADEAFEGSPCVADIDNDRINEIIAGSGNKIYVWKTKGIPEIIEWGCERANPQNTGEYSKTICQDDIIIAYNTTETWTTKRIACRNVIIEPKATLTIKNTGLFMNKDARITIKPGGKLIVDGGTIASVYSEAMWKGIIVEGNASVAHNYSTHGSIELKNRALIENAIKAIESINGGIVRTEMSTIKNCEYGIYLDSYDYAHYYTSIKTSTFVTDKIFAPYTLYPKAHIYMNRVSGISINGNTFKNTLGTGYHLIFPDNTSWASVPYYTSMLGMGIKSVNSSYTVTSIYGIDGMLAIIGAVNTFENLYYAIHASGQKNTIIGIYYNNFINNFKGIYLRETSGARMLFNNIKTSNSKPFFDKLLFPFDGTPSEDVSYAAYINTSTGYVFEENKLSHGNVGLYVFNTGNATGHKIYRNTIDTTTTAGIIIVGKNSNYTQNVIGADGSTGLEILCNKYNGTTNAISVLNGNMRKIQGFNNVIAGNRFSISPANTRDFKVQIQTAPGRVGDLNYSHLDLGIYNYYEPNIDIATSTNYRLKFDPNKISGTQSSNINVFYVEDNHCPNNWKPVPDDIAIEYPRDIIMLKVNLDGMKSEYDEIVDKGNTGYMINTAETMNYTNYTSSCQVLSNDGYLSNSVVVAMIDNNSAPDAAIAAVLIENSPLPEATLDNLENSELNEDLKDIIFTYQEGQNSREAMEYKIAGIKQEIAYLELDLLNNALEGDNDDTKEDAISYFENEKNNSYTAHMNLYSLYLADNNNSAAQNVISQLNAYSVNLPDDIREEVQEYCHINNIYLNSIKNEEIDKDYLETKRDELFEAATKYSTLYSAQAQILYEYISDTIFPEYTPVPWDEISSRSKKERSISKVENLFAPSLSIYPNPGKELVFVEYDFEKNFEEGYELLFKAMGKTKVETSGRGIMSIYNSEGKEIESIDLYNLKDLKSINIKTYTVGTYIIKISDLYGNSKTISLIKE